LQLWPIELFGCTPSMAISASHVALCNLGLDDDPPVPSVREPGHAVEFRLAFAMIELKHTGVAEAAIDAGVRAQLLPQSLR
jgi:hypothetical protein